jgi:methylenetetrahydrofolate reductase (NADPH)
MPPPTLAQPYPEPAPEPAQHSHPALSYELFPPRNTTAQDALRRTIRELEHTAPDYVAVTYGANGSNRTTAVELLEHLLTATSLRPLAHLTCVGNSHYGLTGLIEDLVDRGVRGILALRGDLPQQQGTREGDLRYAQQLVELIRQVERRRSAHLCAGRIAVGVAAYATKHPESPSFRHDLEVLLAKQGSGADFAITQVFFHPGHYARLVQSARQAGVDIPLIPGVMPLTSVRRLERLSQLAGIEIDYALYDRLVSAGDEAKRRSIGIQATVDLANAALDAGAPGLHLYTFNEHSSALEVLDRLQLSRPAPPALVS